jgi:co-chaperonin GroES (HSP10)
MVKYTPIGQRCLIKPYKGAAETDSGLAMASESNINTASVRGIVITSGAESKYQAGQDIYYRRMSVDVLKTIDSGGKEVEVVLVDDEDVLMLVEEMV